MGFGWFPPVLVCKTSADRLPRFAFRFSKFLPSYNFYNSFQDCHIRHLVLLQFFNSLTLSHSFHVFIPGKKRCASPCPCKTHEGTLSKKAILISVYSERNKIIFRRERDVTIKLPKAVIVPQPPYGGPCLSFVELWNNHTSLLNNENLNCDADSSLGITWQDRNSNWLGN